MQDQEFISNDARIHEILNEYRKRQLTEAFSGPGLSFMFHIVVLTLMFVYISTTPKKKPQEFTAIVTPMDEIVLEPEPIIPIEQEEVEDPIKDPNFKPDQAPQPDQATHQENSNSTSDDPIVGDMSQQTTLFLCDAKLTNSTLTLPAMGRRGRRGNGTPGDNGGPTSPPEILPGLNWLQRVQRDNGSWEDNPAHTGLALLCFLGYGEGPTSRRYGETIMKAMRWLVQEQERKGHFGRAYSHGIATYAIADAYAMTRSPRLRPALERAVQRIIDGQQSCGGFDYHYRKGARWDLSVTGWQVQALKAAKMSGAANPGLAQALSKANKFLDTAYRNGKFCYSNEKAGSGNMTGIGALSAQFLGGRDKRITKSALDTIADERLSKMEELSRNGRKWDEMAGNYLYGWYYDTQAVYFNQVRNPRLWKRWKKVCMPTIARAQKPAGYWETSKGHGLGRNMPGRILCTTWCLLQLEVSIRFLPSMSISKHDKVNRDAGIEVIGAGGNGPGLIVEIE